MYAHTESTRWHYQLAASCIPIDPPASGSADTHSHKKKLPRTPAARHKNSFADLDPMFKVLQSRMKSSPSVSSDARISACILRDPHPPPLVSLVQSRVAGVSSRGFGVRLLQRFVYTYTRFLHKLIYCYICPFFFPRPMPRILCGLVGGSSARSQLPAPPMSRSPRLYVHTTTPLSSREIGPAPIRRNGHRPDSC